ncbi:MAG: Si-specific NAD(P)(+) transhydrogenase [Pseudomonadales bacterium]|nr:Si-specific NAD(P)(+) transhydrogenase [Pseudomonadales bacterium]
MNHYDLIVIGSGPGGQKAAIQAAKLGKDVAIVERQQVVGGVTAHTGTIPSKTLREAVLFLSGWRQKAIYGQNYTVKQDITAQDLTQRLSKTVNLQIDLIRNQLERNRVHLISGHASFVDSNTIKVIEVDNREARYSADYFIVATGTVPSRPTQFAFDGRAIMDSDGILKLAELPRTLTVVGAGVIGVEYATIFSALNTKVTLVDARKAILDFMDEDIIDHFKHELIQQGITLRLGDRIETINSSNDRVELRLASGRRIVSECVMVAAGRVGNTSELNLDAVGLCSDDRGRIPVDEFYRTAQPHIYAVGDVIGFPALASTSAEQGRCASCHAFGVNLDRDEQLYPFGIYAVPQISKVGKTEQELQDEGIRYECGLARLNEVARGQIQGGADGLLKLLFSLDDERLLGVHIVGDAATELIHIGQAVIALGGGLRYLTNAVFNYPTFAEAYKVAALDAWNRLHG